MLRRLLKIGVASIIFVAAIPLPALADGAAFGARLKPSQEVPSNDSDGDGEVEFTLRKDRVRFTLEWEDLTSNVGAAHIHCAPAGVNGPVGVTLLMETRDPDDRIRGSFTGPDAVNGCGWVTLGDVVGAVLDGNAYVNVHTTQFLGGEIRGQLKIRPLELETDMDPRQENPPADSDGEGEVEFTLRSDRVRFTLEWEDLTSNVGAAHIHCAPAGVNGPVGVTLLMETRDPDDRIRGSFTGPDAVNGCGWVTLGDVVGAVLDGNAYVNVHTTQFLGGEIRGQLKIRPLELETDMDPRQENPPADSDGEGEVEFTLRSDRVRFTLEWEDLTSNVGAAHIHCAPAGVNGPVGVTLLMETRDPDDRIRGSFTGPDAVNGCGWVTLGDVVGAVLDGNAYVNVHTTQFLGGEIRGQLEIH